MVKGLTDGLNPLGHSFLAVGIHHGLVVASIVGAKPFWEESGLGAAPERFSPFGFSQFLRIIILSDIDHKNSLIHQAELAK
jgi:hypothetical protein